MFLVVSAGLLVLFFLFEAQIDGLDRQTAETALVVEQPITGQFVRVVGEQPVYDQVGGDIPSIRVAFAAPQVMFVDDVQNLVRDNAHGLAYALGFAPLSAEPDVPSVSSHRSDFRRLDPLQPEGDGTQKTSAHEQPFAGFGDDLG